jgi:hypothetical protein
MGHTLVYSNSKPEDACLLDYIVDGFILEGERLSNISDLHYDNIRKVI